MIHHPLIIIPKIVVLAVIIIVLGILHGMLTPEQFRVAVVVAAVLFLCFVTALWTFAVKVLSDPNSKIGQATLLSRQLKSEDGFKASSDQFAPLVGRTGVALSNLNPAGTASIDEQRIPVQTRGEFIETNSPVLVVEAKGSKVVVQQIKVENENKS